MKTYLLFGATGLIGAQLLQRLLASGARVIAPTRRALPPQPQLINPVTDLAPETLAAALAAFVQDNIIAATFCCLGTTIKVAGSKAAFRRIDVELVLAAAQLAKAAGCPQFLAVSSVGADAAANNFYLRCKGEMENSVQALGFARVDMFRPGLLIGARAASRPFETLSQKLLPFVDLLLHGSLRRYRTIKAESVAQAMLHMARQSGGGQYVHHYDDIMGALRP
jgi:uncharacterized protein YbjT (DUF2867 family)